MYDLKRAKNVPLLSPTSSMMHTLTILSTILFARTILARDLCADSVEWDNNICVGYPRIFKQFERNINGTVRKCWIQDLTEEYYDEVVDYYIDDYMRREPLGKYSGCNTEPGCLEDLAANIKGLLGLKLSLVALTTDDSGIKVVIGYNIHGGVVKGDEGPKSEFAGLQKIFDVVHFVESKVDVFKKFRTDSYLDSMGLNVPEKYDGKGIGQEILSMRYTIAKCNGFKLAVSLFTAKNSQVLAKKNGFKDLIVVNYDQLKGTSMEMPGIENDSDVARFMYLRIH